MTKKTLQLFQLFLSLFTIYALTNSFPNEYLIVPLICLICMYFVEKHNFPLAESTNVQNNQAELYG
jgi:hypothetical protein